MLIRPSILALTFAVMSCASVTEQPATAESYETLSEAGSNEKDFSLTSPDRRDISVRAFLPETDCSPCSLIIFSHGANATYDRYDVLLKDWAEKGYVVVAPLHIDSELHPKRDTFDQDDSRVFRVEDYQLLSDMFAADGFTFENLTFSDVQIAAGHSYGALIALIAGGVVPENPDWTLPEGTLKPKAVLGISPPGAMDGLISLEGYSELDVPALIVTGTTDILPGFIDEWQAHLAAYDAADPALAYGLVFDGMDHNFNGAYCRIAPEGATAQPAVDELNSSIETFISAIKAGRAPTDSDWRALSSSDMEAIAK
ncbi:alpha/beta hydrolase family protein [Ponticaulis profundi]|uniref:Alpha/beta hydrolase family protein n=1 Tax=Ponticaulis profundi TaxID=2665222 RepID=A0ABW1S841_9PROT